MNISFGERIASEKISVIMPAFNEETIIQESILKTIEVLQNCEYEIIIVDDGSQDNTYKITSKAMENYETVTAVSYTPNRGKGYALRYGFSFTTGDLIVFLDADLDVSPHQIWILYDVMKEIGSDVVIGCKHHPNSNVKYPWYRFVLSSGYFLIVKFLFGLPLRDTQTGLKLFRRDVLERVFPRLQMEGFSYDLELLIAALRFGFRISEAPVNVVINKHQKIGGISIRTVFKMFFDNLRIFYEASFWNWLRPASITKIYMVAFIIGIVMASFGIANVITFFHFPPWTQEINYYVTMKFIPRMWRNFLLISGGLFTISISLLQLNKSLMRAFSHRDKGDLSGIIQANQNSKQSDHLVEVFNPEFVSQTRKSREEY